MFSRYFLRAPGCREHTSCTSSRPTVDACVLIRSAPKHRSRKAQNAALAARGRAAHESACNGRLQPRPSKERSRRLARKSRNGSPSCILNLERVRPTTFCKHGSTALQSSAASPSECGAGSARGESLDIFSTGALFFISAKYPILPGCRQRTDRPSGDERGWR